MNIAIDFDGTWSLDPEFWQAFASLCAFERHRLIMVTRNTGFTPAMARAGIPNDLTIYYAKAGEFKKDICPHEQIDIWIDDEPGTIEPQRIPNPCPDSLL